MVQRAVINRHPYTWAYISRTGGVVTYGVCGKADDVIGVAVVEPLAVVLHVQHHAERRADVHHAAATSGGGGARGGGGRGGAGEVAQVVAAVVAPAPPEEETVRRPEMLPPAT